MLSSKLSPWTILLLFVVLIAFCSFATAQDPKAAATQTVSGCLQKGSEPYGGFYLITDKNKHLELYDDGKASLGDHVGQKVSVTGTPLKRSADQEKTSQPYEKQETGTKQHGDFQVASVTMVSATCSK